MKIMVKVFFWLYQQILSPFLKAILGTDAFCRYVPSCSEYTRRMILKYGLFKGVRLGIIRIGSCR